MADKAPFRHLVEVGAKMNIIERTLNDVTVLDLKGNLALEGNKQFRQHVAATIDAGVRKESQGIGAISKPHLIHLRDAQIYLSGASPGPSEKGVL
jgi:hypothetical protein